MRSRCSLLHGDGSNPAFLPLLPTTSSISGISASFYFYFMILPRVICNSPRGAGGFPGFGIERILKTRPGRLSGTRGFPRVTRDSPRSKKCKLIQFMFYAPLLKTAFISRHDAYSRLIHILIHIQGILLSSSFFKKTHLIYIYILILILHK